ncbi:MAG: hypothetical protein AAGC74_13855, partial [Verrucomicrobiota bacterium]
MLSLLLSILLTTPTQQPGTLGTPPQKPLKTTELREDANQRLTQLLKGSKLGSNQVFKRFSQKKGIWSQQWPRRLDLTGINWLNKQAGVAITPRHLVHAAHYPYFPHTKEILFHDREGNPHKRKIARRITLQNEHFKTDIAIVLLAEPLPPSIKTYRLLPPRTDYPHTLENAPVITTNQFRELHIHAINRIGNRGVSFRKNPLFPTHYKNLIKGDSGHPSFLLVGGEPVLIQTHSGGGAGSGPFYSDPDVFAALVKACANLDPNYQIQTVPLDPQLAPAPAKASPKQPQKHQPSPAPTSPEPTTPRVRGVPTPTSDVY